MTLDGVNQRLYHHCSTQTLSMPRSSKNWISIVLSVSLMLCSMGALIYWWAFYMREHHRWSEDLKLWNGEILHVQHHMSRKAYHGLVGHFSPFWWGGGDWRYELWATVGRNKYYWKGLHTPIAVQADEDGTVYIVAFDRTSEEARHKYGPMFRFYRALSDESWNEIAPETFPKHLAIQNRECNRCSAGNDEDRSNIIEVIARMDPSEDEFRLSLNSGLWAFLEDPTGKAIDGKYPPVNFLQEFKDRWIRPCGKPTR